MVVVGVDDKSTMDVGVCAVGTLKGAGLFYKEQRLDKRGRSSSPGESLRSIDFNEEVVVQVQVPRTLQAARAAKVWLPL